jgi:hypothetical protein
VRRDECLKDIKLCVSLYKGRMKSVDGNIYTTAKENNEREEYHPRYTNV